MHKTSQSGTVNKTPETKKRSSWSMNFKSYASFRHYRSNDVVADGAACGGAGILFVPFE
jgi:hypothetical protein